MMVSKKLVTKRMDGFDDGVRWGEEALGSKCDDEACRLSDGGSGQIEPVTHARVTGVTPALSAAMQESSPPSSSRGTAPMQ
ncbi:hypothetical protein PIB30_102290 [Stylosanthes scabra]|uniref:Uncharacterized protein n=1 Tax=Stylosanthes scabra TaxID=79078 RepID=A0ABU6WVX1_9FABA|nr:hypothetical protein [Stylosanthes scabra]